MRCADLEYEKTLETDGIDRVIIATPTSTHYRYVKFFAAKGIDILCEKPVDTSYDRVRVLLSDISVRFNVVCNWSYVYPYERLQPGKNIIVYNNVSSGRDGLAWDCCQLIYLADDFKVQLKTGVPWDIRITDKEITPKMIEDSYTRMMADWLVHPDRLWSTEDVLQQTAKVEKFIEENPDANMSHTGA